VDLSFRDIGQFVLQQPALKGRNMVQEQNPFYVVMLVLYDPGSNALEHLIVKFKVLILVFKTYAGGGVLHFRVCWECSGSLPRNPRHHLPPQQYKG
jgi:hypothetical protein